MFVDIKYKLYICKINNTLYITIWKKTNKNTTPRNTNTKTNYNRSIKRANPMIPKAGITRSGRRSFENGGKIE